MLANTRSVSVILVTISYLSVNLININLLSLQPIVQVGEVANANPANARKILTWAAKAVGTGALSAAGAWGFNQAVGASKPKPVQQPNRVYVGSSFSSQHGSVYFWNSQNGLWHFYEPRSQQFLPVRNPAEVLYRTSDAYQLSNGQYQWERPNGNYGYTPTQGWVRFI
ncbi:MAG: hypothetical protein KAF91_25030 [Nostoc sp. TH1S01]|nr:hypothetical protein [Nostoc sp. TH1S01]